MQQPTIMHSCSPDCNNPYRSLDQLITHIKCLFRNIHDNIWNELDPIITLCPPCCSSRHTRPGKLQMPLPNCCPLSPTTLSHKVIQQMSSRVMSSRDWSNWLTWELRRSSVALRDTSSGLRCWNLLQLCNLYRHNHNPRQYPKRVNSASSFIRAYDLNNATRSSQPRKYSDADPRWPGQPSSCLSLLP